MVNGFTLKEIVDILFGKVNKVTTPYVYAIVSLIDGKWYIGSRIAKRCHPNELGVSYFTSSKSFRPIFKCNPENFRTIILYIGEDAVEKEAEFLNIMRAKDNQKSYNLHNGAGYFNGKKAAERTFELGVGVHARTKEQMKIDALKMVEIHKPIKSGIFAPGVADKGRETQRKLGIAAFSPENRRKGALRSGKEAKLNKTGIFAVDYDRSKGAKVAHQRRFKCVECQLTGPATSIALHQKASKHRGRTELIKDSEEWIKSFRSAKAGT